MEKYTTNIIDFLSQIDKPNNKYVWCIKGNAEIIEFINIDISETKIKDIILFTCPVKDILENTKAKKLLKQTRVLGYEEKGNDLFVLADCNNHQSIKNKLNLLGIF